MTRKRQRSSLLLLGVCFPLVDSFQWGSASFRRGFSIIAENNQKIQRISLRYSITSTVDTTLPSDLTLRTKSKEPSTREEPKQENLPPWLSQYGHFSLSEVKEQIQWLEYQLMEQGFLVADITQVVTAVDRVAAEDAELAAGLLDFLRLLLSLRQDESGAFFVTTPVLLASILHYADCVAARRRGIPDALKEALLRQTSTFRKVEFLETASSALACTQQEPPPLGNSRVPVVKGRTTLEPSPYEPEVRIICKGAARVKRAECLAHAVLQNHGVTQTQASRLRDFYLMCMDQDWRSLAIRVAACLYRLEGLLREEQEQPQQLGASEFAQKSPQVVQTAREAMRIYAPLAQRLGMHRLKAMIEERAFRLQYRRQYKAVSALYRETGEVMESVSTYLQNHVRQIVQNDEALVAQLRTLQVTGRVKEPYSFWRKLLNQKVKGLLKPWHAPQDAEEDDQERRTLSITQVNDAVALRVILTARKLSPDEPDDTTRARERMLCYYVQHLIRAQWPETDAGRLKDYIANPKPNGYQSLHHTSRIASRGIKFPFEVQVRSAEMHARAEFGVSAHWEYKLSGRGDESSLKSAAPSMALPPQDIIEAKAALTNEKWDEALFSNSDSSPSTPPVAGGYVTALVNAKEDMLRNQIYVFIMGDGNEQGELVSVPSNSSIGDAIDEIEHIIPAKVQIWKNGRLADMNEKLENGDVVMIAI